jgi:hypothetical protein
MKEQLPKTIKLTNSFHNTQTTIRYKDWMAPYNPEITWLYISYRANDPRYHDRKNVHALAQRIKRKLCGSKDCKCGTVRE